MEKEAFIFDMDGVLIDNHDFHKKAWKDFIEQKCPDKEFDFEYLMKNYFGKTNSIILEYVFEKKLSESEIKVLENEKENYYRKIYSPHIKEVKGLTNLLIKVKSNHLACAIGTSGPPENVEFVISKLGIKKYFDVIVDSSQISNGKPDPEVYLKVSQKLNINPNRCIVFEDSFSGIEAGLRAGMMVVGITTGHDKKTLLKKGVNKAINNFDEFDFLE